jgi:endonuclease VIII
LHSHLRMNGRWRVEPRGSRRVGQPWLVLRGDTHEGVLWNGPVLELRRDSAPVSRLGPDILAVPPDIDGIVERLRGSQPAAREVGDALLDQRLVGGIGNVWKVESLWVARVSPWRRLANVSDEQLRAVLEEANRLMRNRLAGTPSRANVYRRKGRRCPRCGTAIRSWPQGDAARMAYWCPECQRGEEPPAK